MSDKEHESDLNVLGETLEECGRDPLTGWFRDGCCRTDENDHGSHTVCAIVTAEFLAFSKGRGNDLSTPRPALGFAGLKPGDSWCLCASRWLEAHAGGAAPQVRLAATHLRALDLVPLVALAEHAVDPVAIA